MLASFIQHSYYDTGIFEEFHIFDFDEVMSRYSAIRYIEEAMDLL